MPSTTPFDVFQEHINRYIFASHFANNRRILDIACGIGYGSTILIRTGKAKEIIGGDLAKDAISYANRHHKSDKTIFLRASAANLPFRDCCFQLVLSFETIEHLRDPRRFLIECNRVLTRGGLIICSTPNKRVFSPYTKNPTNPFHIHEFRLEEFFHILVKNGFTDVKTFGQRSLIPRERIKSMAFGLVSKLLSPLTAEYRIKEKLRTLIILKDKRGDTKIKRSQIKPTYDKDACEKYRVFSYPDNTSLIPAFLVLVAKKESP